MKKQIELSDHFSYAHLIRFTLPSIVMMIFTSIYGIVDGFFISNFAGKTPFAAVNLIIPFLMIMATIGFMLGTGGSAIIAKTLGEGDKEKANNYFSFFVYFSFLAGVILALIGIVFIRPISIFLGAEGQLLEDCILYARIILIALPFNILQYLFQSFFVTAEKPQLGLITSICAGVTNMVLDAVLVILLPQPYILAGAAIATAASEITAGLIPIIYFGRKNSSILGLGKADFDGKILLKACINGSSEFMSNISMNLVGMVYNIQLLKYAGENGVAAFGVLMYIGMISAGAFIGYSIGSAPIFGYNDGAKNYSELRNLLKKSLKIIGILSLFMVGAIEMLATPLSKIFVSYDKELLEMTVSALQIFSLAFLFMGYAIFASGFFTAMNDGIISAIISFLRTLVFQVPAVLILPLYLGIDGIWYSVMVAEMMAIVISAVFMIGKRNKYHY